MTSKRDRVELDEARRRADADLAKAKEFAGKTNRLARAWRESLRNNHYRQLVERQFGVVSDSD